MSELVPTSKARTLTAKQFGHLADAPPEFEFTNF